MKPPAWSKDDTIAVTPQVVLEIQRGRAKYRIRPVSPPVFLIGRASDCDLVLGDPQFPDLHTYLFVTDSGVVARYLGHGPKLNINGMDRESCEVGNGSLIRMGTYEFKVHIKTPSRRPERRTDSTDTRRVGRAHAFATSDESTVSALHVDGSHDIIIVEDAPHLRVYSGPGQRISA